MIFLILPVMAQTGFSIRGTASQMAGAEGFAGAHPSLPLNSIVKITNPGNGKEAEIAIIGRIEQSPDRIIDLSPAVFLALDMRAGGTVILTVSVPVRPTQADIIELARPAGSSRDTDHITILQPTEENTGNFVANAHLATKFPAQIITEEQVEMAVSGQSNQTRDDIINQLAVDFIRSLNEQDRNTVNYLIDLADGNHTIEFLAWLMAMTIDAREAREAQAAREAREAR